MKKLLLIALSFAIVAPVMAMTKKRQKPSLTKVQEGLLISFMKHKNTEKVEDLIKRNSVEVNYEFQFDKDFKGRALIHLAASNNLLALLKFFIEKGAHVNILMKAKEKTPLHYASAVSTEATKLLVDAGANVKAKDINGLTPLHYAAGVGKFDIVKYLVEKAKADVNAIDNDGKKPSAYAKKDSKGYLKEKEKK